MKWCFKVTSSFIVHAGEVGEIEGEVWMVRMPIDAMGGDHAQIVKARWKPHWKYPTYMYSAGRGHRVNTPIWTAKCRLANRAHRWRYRSLTTNRLGGGYATELDGHSRSVKCRTKIAAEEPCCPQAIPALMTADCSSSGRLDGIERRRRSSRYCRPWTAIGVLLALRYSRRANMDAKPAEHLLQYARSWAVFIRQNE